MVSASESVAANLNPPLGDVDLGMAVQVDPIKTRFESACDVSA